MTDSDKFVARRGLSSQSAPEEIRHIVDTLHGQKKQSKVQERGAASRNSDVSWNS